MAIIHDPAKEASVSVTPIPQTVFMPATEGSYPFNAASRQVWPTDLGKLGYSEEEYLVSGLANVYAWGQNPGDPMLVRVEEAPYTFRILVRKPSLPTKFSGSVVVELFNYAHLMDNPGAGWGALNEYLTAHGDAWVGISIRDSSFRALKKFDPARYAALSMKNPVPPDLRGEPANAYGIAADPECENGLSYDVISQVGMLIRSGKSGSPFHGYGVKYVYATGASAGDLTSYAGLVHNYAIQQNGAPVYDGFSIFMTGAPANLNIEEKNILAPEPRCIIHPKVPTFRILTLGDMLGVGIHPDWSLMQRRPDGDEPGDQYRIYELAGAATGYRPDKPAYPRKEDADRVGARWIDPFPALPDYAFPVHHFLRNAFDLLKKWVERGITPPRADRLAFDGEYPDSRFSLDEYGNAKGGIRSPYVDVPIATYHWDGKIDPFPPEQIRKLYPTQNDYLAKVALSCQRLYLDRWILPEDAWEIIATAKRVSDRW